MSLKIDTFGFTAPNFIQTYNYFCVISIHLHGKYLDTFKTVDRMNKLHM